MDLSGDEPQVTTLPAPVPRRMADVTGTLDDLLGAAGEPHVDDWVRVTVTDAARPADLFRRVRQRFAHALVVQHRPDRPDTGATRPALVTAAADPVEVAADFVAHVTGALPTAAERRVLRDAYEHVAGAERSA